MAIAHTRPAAQASASALAALALVCAPTAPLRAETKVLSPSGQWNVNFGETNCRLARYFGEGEDRHILFFEQYRPSASLGMTLAGASLKRFRSRARTFVQVNDAQEPLKTEPYKGDVAEIGPAIIHSSLSLDAGSQDDDDQTANQLPQLDTQFADTVEFVSLTQGKRTVRLDTGPLGAAFDILNQCTQDMVKSWGLDVDKHLTATRLPKWSNEASVVRRIVASYPSKALRRGEQAILQMRVIVDQSGKVTSCTIDEATRAGNVESPACAEMAKAKFDPALDADGEAFTSYYSTSIIYRIG
ncbi:MAG: energy transducer TonB [Pseudomonadota bacterium]